MQGLVLSRDFSNSKHVSFVVLSVFGKFFVNSTSSHCARQENMGEVCREMVHRFLWYGGLFY